ncbi:MAG TPA: BCD family MFS transporter [Anaerolineaceae bacterium]|nr:BCD family MFS transporter [Anaerolineaceae bacterium]
MLRKRIQLALIHAAVAMTLVPINSTLNRIMIKELAISATLVAVLASLPYLFSPVQVAIGSYSDRHPLFGFRRTPYILIGLLLCVLGVILAPMAVFTIPENLPLGLLYTALTFGAWGMGYNLSAVTYLSLASELSGEQGRSRTIAVMFFVMILGIIATATTLSRLLETYTPQTLEQAFLYVALVALALGLLGLVRLEPRALRFSPNGHAQVNEERSTWRAQIGAVIDNPQARRFFLYLTILLAAILGQDVLLEPFAAEAFDLPVTVTTRITSIWGTAFLLSLAAANPLERWLPKRRVAQLGALVAIAGFTLIAASGLAGVQPVFYTGVVLLGLGTGLATVSNLSLMLDMTTTQVGLYMGAWGIANAMSRLIGNVLGGVVRDTITFLTQNPVAGYVFVFVIEAGLLVISLLILRSIDVGTFRRQAEISLTDRVAMLND